MSDETKQCPYCGEEILAVAKKCKHCGEWLEEKKDENNENTNSPVINSPKKNNSKVKYIIIGLLCTLVLISFIAIAVNLSPVYQSPEHQLLSSCSDNGEDIYYCKDKPWKEVHVKGGPNFYDYYVYFSPEKYFSYTAALIWDRGQYYCRYINGDLGKNVTDAQPCSFKDFMKMLSSKELISQEEQYLQKQKLIEKRTELQKAVSTLNQALSLNYALEGVQIGDKSLNSEQKVLENLFKKRMSVVSTEANVPFAKSSQINITPIDNQNVFYTANYVTKYTANAWAPEANNCRFVFVINEGKYSPTEDEYYYGYILIDVNGDEGPNKITTDIHDPQDTCVATIFGNRIVPGIDGSDDPESVAAREIMNYKK